MTLPTAIVDKDSAIPYYLQLADILRNQIRDEEFGPDDLIPSERELCDSYNVSRSTVRQTMQLLKEEGLVRKQRGVGTRVARSPKLEQDLLGYHNFDLQMLETGHDASITVLKHEVLKGPGRVQRLMNLEFEDRIFKVVRLRMVDDEPVFIEKIYMSLTRFPGIQAQDFLDTDIFLKRLKTKYGTRLGQAKVFIEPVLLDELECETMRIKARPSPGLMLERISYDDGGTPIAVTKRVFRGDRCRHMLVIKSG